VQNKNLLWGEYGYFLELHNNNIYIVLFIDYSSSRTIEDLLNKWGLQGIEIPLEEFNADQGNVGGSNLSDLHTIHMLEITIKQSLHKGNVLELYQDNS